MQQLAHATRRRSFVLSLPITIVYRTYSLFLLGVDIPVSTRIGKNLQIHHGFGLVIHPNAVIGDNVILRHGVTIGAIHPDAESDAPILGDHVDVGAGAILLGGIKIGSHAKIGAGAIVTRDVPPGAICRALPSEIFTK
jgi:serine acetyltransferase